VGIWVIVCIQKPSHHILQTFSPPRMFKIVYRDSSLHPKQLSFILSAKVDQRKRWPHFVYITSFCSHRRICIFGALG